MATKIKGPQLDMSTIISPLPGNGIIADGNNQLFASTSAAGSKRQAITAAPVDSTGAADFIAPVGDGTTKHLSHWDSYTTTNIVADEVFGTSSSTRWSCTGSANLVSTWKKFGTNSLYLPSTNQYAQLTGSVFQYKTAVNGWTEEFFIYPTSSVANRLIFRGGNSSNYGIVLATTSTGALRIYLSSTGSSWNISNAVILPITLAINTEYHIAIVYNNVDYRVFVNGTLVYTKASGLKINSIYRRIFGWSSSGYTGYIDEYRCSSAPLYTTSATVPTSPYTYTKNPRVVLVPNEGDTLLLSASTGGADVPIVISSPITSAPLRTNNINYLYIDSDVNTGAITLGSTPIQPQYGTTYDTTVGCHLNFDVHGTDIDTTSTLIPGGVYVDSSPEIDYCGNQWFSGPNNVTSVYAGDSGDVSASLYLDGSSDSFLTSTVYALPARWTFKFMFAAYDVNAPVTHTIFTYGGNVNGYGLRLQWDQANRLFRVWISTTGSSWNVANNATVAAAYDGSSVIFSFDGTKYSLKTYSPVVGAPAGVTTSWASTQQVVGSPGSVIEIGKTYQSTFAKGFLNYFQMLPYYDSTEYRKSTALASNIKPTFRSDFHYFDLSTMTMGTTKSDSPSLIPAAPPDFSTKVRRVFIGEATLDGVGVTDIRSYAINGDYRSGWFPVSPANSYVISHNLGCDQYVVQNYVNKFPRDRGRREETGSFYYNTPDGYGRSGGAGRVSMSAVDLTLKIGTYLTSPANVADYDDYTTGYYYTIVRRNF